MIETALQICVAAVAVSMLLCTWRLWRGPLRARPHPGHRHALHQRGGAGHPAGAHLADRALLFEAALIVAMLGFVSTVALARFITRGDVIE